MRSLLPWFVFALVLLAFQIASAGQIISGPATVSDGDTLKIYQKNIRLFGIDAPERSQSCLDRNGSVWSCGAAAKAQLANYIQRQNVTCSITGKDRYERYLGICLLGEVDLNARLVREGLALAYRRYSKTYVPQEDEARRRKLGLWQGHFTAPWEWRAGKRLKKGGSNSVSGCVIKGNINSKGIRIYHTPSSPWYSRTKVSPAKGERWFCSEEEARAAGWRAPR